MAEPSINFGTSSKFGTLSGLVAQDANPTISKQLARSLDEDGDEAAAKTYDEKTEVTQNFKSSSASAPTLPAKIGAKAGDYILTGINISTNWNDFAQVSLTGHNHTENAHADTLRQAAHGITLSAGFGANEFLGATAGSAVLQSSTCNIVCQHVDANDADGDHSHGQNYDAVITVTETWQGVPTTNAGSGWTVTNVATNETNTNFVTTVVTAQKSVALAAPVSTST